MPDQRDSVGVIAIRSGLVVLAFVLLWLMEEVLAAAREEYSGTFRFPVGQWLGATGLTVLVGAAFAAAGWYTSWSGRYRIGRVLVMAVIPLVLLLVTYLFLIGSLDALPAFAQEAFFRFGSFFGFGTLPAMLLGVALVAGATGKN
ncbi:MAG: hypothetical protein ACRDJP_03270 [Actinomycetota bacterium]